MEPQPLPTQLAGSRLKLLRRLRSQLWPLRRAGGSCNSVGGSPNSGCGLARHKALDSDYRNTGGTELQAVAARKGESYETADSHQGWSSRSEPQHNRSLTVAWGMCRSREVRSCPESFKLPGHKGESYETQNQNQGRQALLEPQHHRSLTVVWGMYGVRHTQSTRKPKKGESYEAQNQSQGRKALLEPQHNCSLIGLAARPFCQRRCPHTPATR